MKTYSHYPPANRPRRASAVYRSLPARRPTAGLIARQLGLLALLTLGIAGFIGLRAWLALGN